MSRLVKVALALLWAAASSISYASTSAMTATLTDSEGTVWSNCHFTATLNIIGGSSTPAPTIGGVTVSPLVVTGDCNGSGIISATLTDTSSVDQKNAQWVFKVQSNTSAPPVTVTTSVVGASPNLTTSFSLLTPPRFAVGAGINAFGYSDVEVLNPLIGNVYFNTGTVCGGPSLRQLSNAGWQCAGGGGGGSASLISGAIADYKFLNGTGNTVTDTSGNGNDATLTAGRSPSWIKNGLQFTGANQSVDLPVALNSGLTFEFVAYFEPMNQAANGQCLTNSFPLIMSSTQGLAGVNFLYAGDSICGVYRLQALANSSNTTQTKENFAGLHVITAVFGTGAGNVDHFYIDGIETTYTIQNFTGGKATSGHLFIGSPGVSPYTASGFLGKFYRMRVFNSQLSAQDVASDSAALMADLASRGVATTPPTPILPTPQLNIFGDSISCASANGSTCTPSFSWATQLVLTNQPTYTLNNWAVYGTFISAWAASEPWRGSPYCRSKTGPNVAIIFGGANDARIYNGPTMALSASAAIQAMKDAGCRVYIGTMISRSGNTQQSGTPSYDSQKDAYDALIGSSWKSWGADGMLDFAANPLMGADGASANTTYFQADGTHPTAAGEALLAAAASNTLNYYSGYTNSGPNIVTANTYQMASGDGAITAAPTANAAYTMPDCIGPSGAAYTINNPQSAFTLSIVGKASQPINGLATPITIPSNSTVTLHDVPNDRSVSGCHWSM